MFFLSYEVFVREKLLLLLFTIGLFFILLFSFYLFRVFRVAKIFLKKNNFVLVASFTILLQ